MSRKPTQHMQGIKTSTTIYHFLCAQKIKLLNSQSLNLIKIIKRSNSKSKLSIDAAPP